MWQPGTKTGTRFVLNSLLSADVLVCLHTSQGHFTAVWLTGGTAAIQRKRTKRTAGVMTVVSSSQSIRSVSTQPSLYSFRRLFSET